MKTLPYTMACMRSASTHALGRWTMLGLLVVAGCVPSLNPVYTDDTLTFDSALLGVWKQPGSKASWQFTRHGEKSYRLLYTDEEGQQGKFIGRLARLDGELFLDLFPEEPQIDASTFYTFHLVPIHTIYRVRRTPQKLELATIDFKWLDNYLTSHPQEIEFATFNGRKLVTASTAAVQKFVLAHKERFSNVFPLQKEEPAN